MDEKHLRQLMETNFQLLSLGLRDIAVRTGGLENSFKASQQALSQAQEGLGRTQESLAQTQEAFAEAKLDIAANRRQLTSMADRLDETVEAIKLLAFGGVDDRLRLSQLEESHQELLGRVKRLEEAS